MLNFVQERGIGAMSNRIAIDSNMKDDFKLIHTYIEEIKQYYSISKRHAQMSFTVAITFCILGFVLFIFYILYSIMENTISIMPGIIGGAISELFAGTALLLHKSSLTQLNLYYKALYEKERFLSMVYLVNRLSKSKQDDVIKDIINSTIKDVSLMVEKNNE